MAISKVAQAKIDQEWTKVLDMCDNCKYMVYREERSAWNTDTIYKNDIKCSLGNFATKKTYTCKCHTYKIGN